MLIEGDQGGGDSPKDDYQTRLVKYIPGESLAFYGPLSSLIAENAVALIVATGIGVIGTVLYLRQSSRHLKAPERPLPHYYALSAFAFLVWALCINAPLATLLGISSLWKNLILACTVFLIPLIDDELAYRGL
ncbi:MAG: hypothetical protein ACK52U_01100 [Synechococcaceae cyanobacterium]